MSHHETQRARDATDGHASPNAAGGATMPPYRSSPRAMLLLLVAMLLFFVATAVLIRLIFATRIPELTAARLEHARQLWQRHGPKSYDLDVEIRGARPGDAHVEVRDSVVTAATRDSREPPRWTWDEWTVPGQFDTLERELEMAEDPEHEMQAPAGAQLHVHCEFDPQFGFPRRYHRFGTSGVPEVYWQASRFQPYGDHDE
jgi:hypothetical protein